MTDEQIINYVVNNPRFITLIAKRLEDMAYANRDTQPVRQRIEMVPQANILVWEPRYKDNMVLIATHKVKAGKNYLAFTKAKHLVGNLYEFDGEDAMKCHTQKNGAGYVYVYPFARLKRVK